MGFANSSCSFTRFRILDQVTDDVLRNVPENLKKWAFKDIDDTVEMQSHGWVPYEDMLDCEWVHAHPQKGQYFLFSLRLDTRRIPAGVIKKYLALALRGEKERLAQNNQNFVSRERKKELKEQVMLKLRQRFLPVPGEFNILWNIGNGEVWFASTQGRMIDLFMELFLNTFNLHLEPLSPFNLALSLMGEENSQCLDALESTRFVKPAMEKSL